MKEMILEDLSHGEKLKQDDFKTDHSTNSSEVEKPFNCSDCDKSSKLKVMSWNINRGISKHWDQIVDTIDRENPDIIFLLDTDISEDSSKSIEINGYKTLVGKPWTWEAQQQSLNLSTFLQTSLTSWCPSCEGNPVMVRVRARL